MAWTKKASGSATHSGHVITVTLDTTGADLLFVSVAVYSSTDAWAAFSDNKSNSWTQLTGAYSNGNASGLLWGWCVPTSVGASHSFTFNGTYNFGTMYVQAWSGAHASPFDQQSIAADTVDGTSRDTGSLTPSVGGSLCLSAVAIANTNTTSGISVGSSFTLQDSQNSGASNIGGGSASKESSSAENPSWSWTGSNKAVAGLAIFKPAAGGGGGSTRAGSRMLSGMGR